MSDDRHAEPDEPPERVDRSAASRVFAPATSSVTQARHWAERIGRRWGLREEALSRLAFNTTELAANAVMHARTPFRVSLRYQGERVRLEVEDASVELPREVHGGRYATGGRGIAMVRALSVRTGARRDGDGGKRVWAEIDA